MTKLLRHVVLFKFRDGISTEKVKEIENAFMATGITVQVDGGRSIT